MTTQAPSAAAPLIRAAALLSQGKHVGGIREARAALLDLAEAPKESIEKLLVIVFEGVKAIENQKDKKRRITPTT